jgi:serine protease Do
MPFLLAALLGVGIGAAAFYQYQENRSIETRFGSIQNELGLVAQALGAASSTNRATQTQLQEIANRSQVAARSQNPSLTTAVSKVVPAVVSVVISEEVPKLQVHYENPFGDDPNFQGFNIQIPVYQQVGTTTQEVGAGSGFLVRSNGYILTNKHVIIDPNASYTILLSNGAQKTAKVVYKDPNNDVAVLKIDGTGYPTVSLGDSSSVQLGETVAAIGNALGEYNNSVSTGIISGLNRSVQAQDENGNVENLNGIIQTDAAINPGNSGGPLLDLNGNVVGINVATVAGANNIGFAIPINSVKAALNKALAVQ